MLDRSAPPLLRFLLPLLAAWVLVDLWLTNISTWGDQMVAGFIYCGVIATAGLATAARGIGRRAERGPWLLVGAGLMTWAAGDVFYTLNFFTLDLVPVPSWADVGYLLLPPLVAVGLVWLVRARAQRVPIARMADAGIAALAVAALGAAIVMPTVRGAVEGRGLEIATALAYPITDLLLIAVCVGALAGRGWSVDRCWIAMSAGLLALWTADSMYLVQNAHGAYDPAAIYNAGWTGGAVAIAFAAWQPVQNHELQEHRLRVVVMPFVLATLALALLVAVEGEIAVTIPAALALLMVFVRMGLAFRETGQVLRGAQEEAVTDALTGLGNRRALTQDLDGAVRAGRPTVLALFDLDGFKGYNDTFGHPAGDALLMRLGQALATTIDGHGGVFRMGGDEFCALLPAGADGGTELVARARAALTEQGEGFSIGCSHGSVLVPGEAETAAEALRIADQRMYAEKRSERASAGRQTRDVLLQALIERSPALEGHVHDVAVLAEATASRMGLADADVDEIRHAAELHDVGKVAIPDAILDKRGPLDESEWKFMHRHTLIGERIVAAAPALATVGRLVRSSHERWDGAGYPDSLAGTAIPLGARIIAVADAFDAMTVDRPYRAAMSVFAALAELDRCAGTQFDPAVVVHFRAAIQGLAPIPAGLLKGAR